MSNEVQGEWRGFRARFRGTCAKCQATVNPGDPIRWSKRQRGVVYHATCFGDGAAPAPTGDIARDVASAIEQAQAQATANAMDSAPAQSEAAGATDDMLPRERAAAANPIDHDEVRRIAKQEAHSTALATSNTVLEGVKDALSLIKADVQRKLDSERTLTVHITRQDAPAVRIDNAHCMVPKLLQVIGARRHAYLYGPPGSGKSKAAQQVSEALGMRYGYMSLNPQTPESRLLGFIDAGGHYRRTSFRDCFEHGGVFCIDEMDNAHPALLNTLNGMVEPGATLGAFPDGVIIRHAEFVLIGTGNTAGRGGDILFPERRALDSAFMERFVFLAWEYDLALEQALTLAHGPKNGMAWLTFVRTVRAYCKEHGIRLWATPRAAMTGAMFLDTLPDWSAREVADAVLFKGIDRDTAERVLGACALPTVVR